MQTLLSPNPGTCPYQKFQVLFLSLLLYWHRISTAKTVFSTVLQLLKVYCEQFTSYGQILRTYVLHITHRTSDDIRILALLDIHGFHYQQYMAPEEICLERITLSSFLINNPDTDPAFKYESPLSSLFPLSPLYSSYKLNKLGRENTHYPEIFLSVILFFLYCFFDITRFLWMRHAVVEFWVIFLKTINF